MAMTLKAIADFSACYKANRKMPKGVPEGIIVHSTGANNPNLKRYVNAPEICGVNPNKNYFGGPGSNDVTPHGVVGKDKNGRVRGVQILPYDICCWGCGSGSKGSYNYNPAYIQFEIAEDGLNDSVYFDRAFDLMAQICAELMQIYPSIKLENVISHKEACARGYASNHGDPENWLSKFGKTMSWFRDKVKSYSKSSATTTNTKPTTTNNKVVYSPLSEVIDPKVGSVTAIFREYSKTLWSSTWHNGVDIGAPANTPVKAVADGTVVDNSTMKQRPTDNFGNRVIIEHADGVFSVYAHLVAPTTLKVGDKVKRGQIVGKVGGTGKTQNQYGNHLHLTMLKGFKKELYNIYYVNNELLDPIKMCGIGTMKFSTLANDTILENGAIKHLGNLNTYYGVSTANTSTVTSNKNSATSTNIKVGDIVEFTGSTHYGSSTATKGTDATAGKAKVTTIAPNAAHKYHLVHVDDTSNVYGWVNASDIKVAGTKSLDELANEVIRGEWGNGVDRKNRLTSAGYDYAAVQKKVDEKLSK